MTLSLAFSTFVWAQPLPRAATTVSALIHYPGFYHGQRIVVRGELSHQDDLVWLSRGDLRVLCLGVSRVTSDARQVEISGTFWDVGRLDIGDPRLAPHNLSDVSERLLKKSWPGAGELFAVAAEATTDAPVPAAPTVRTLALQPERYADQQVTIVGRFRGRNLYGDLPQAPGRGRWDFVLQSADAAIWVTGLEPRGPGFRLDVDARVDTGRWLEVSGTVRHERGLVWIHASGLRVAPPPADAPSATVVAVPRPKGLPPEVIFSAPTQGDTDVPPDTTVRVQFSRDMDSASFKGQVRVSYLQGESPGRGEPAPPPIAFALAYREGNRVLEIRFTDPLEQFRLLRVELLPGIAALDGVTMEEAWLLTFALGG